HRVAQAQHLVAPTMEQPQYNLLDRERVEVEYASLYAEFGMGTTIFSPLASGLLTGKYNDGIPAGSRLAQDGLGWLQRGLRGDRIDALRRYTALAAELGVGPGTLAIAWCLRNPNVSTVMLGASKLSQLLQNFEALEAWQRFDDAAWQRIEASLA
ncbi:MAG TPA: aldo/keto reductase, partial [Thermomonas sp.]|nr:aldo/keto reductase [Thermomonas sp.]